VHNLGQIRAMMLYLIEILPYTMRAKDVTLIWFVTRAAGAFNTYVNPIGLKAMHWKFYFLYVE
jgi:hypothetical protein